MEWAFDPLLVAHHTQAILAEIEAGQTSPDTIGRNAAICRRTATSATSANGAPPSQPGATPQELRDYLDSRGIITGHRTFQDKYRAFLTKYQTELHLQSALTWTLQFASPGRTFRGAGTQ